MVEVVDAHHMRQYVLVVGSVVHLSWLHLEIQSVRYSDGSASQCDHPQKETALIAPHSYVEETAPEGTVSDGVSFPCGDKKG